MAFTLVIAPPPPQQDRGPEHVNWTSFWVNGGLEKLSKSEGVFCIHETAWIFDTRKTLPLYAKVIHVAHELKVQLFVFQLDGKSVLAHGVSYPQSEKLEKFLSS